MFPAFVTRSTSLAPFTQTEAKDTRVLYLFYQAFYFPQRTQRNEGHSVLFPLRTPREVVE